MVTLVEVTVESRAEWRGWLLDHHASSPGVWLSRWKKDSGRPHVPYDDVVEEALCFGWVDSQPRSVDVLRSLLRVSPRSPRSSWSAVNKARVERLIAAGLMHASGLAVVEAAKASGTWAALDQVEQLVEPPDLATRLDADPDARREWDAFPRSTRRAILEWLSTARTEATRTKRLERIVVDAHVGVRANQWRQRG
ncbi:MAG: YdeI/OmpD-associated family protein [Jatrophihabitans sp.]|uniref:YdeI/OmpD-associated family protein n=1 Tax=Jatrophihabitans sp. TaxID=1932789 RepID=UPI003F7D1167